MSIQLLTTCQPDAMRGAATAVSNWVDSMATEFTPLNLKALALLESDWDGEASVEFEESWIEFRTGCGILVEVMRDAAAIVTRLADALALAQRQFRSAVDEAEAAGLRVDLTTGEVSPPLVVLSPEPPFPLGSRELEVADQVRRANLQIQDAVREATAADQRAGEDLAALKPRVDMLVPILRNLGVAVEGYGGIAGTVGAVATGLSGSLSATARGWQNFANHPVLRPAGTPLFRMPGGATFPRLGAIGAPLAFGQNLASGDDVGRAATRAATSTVVGYVAGGVATGLVAAGVGLLGAGVVTAGAPIVLGIGVAVGVGASIFGAQWGDELGQQLHDHVLSPFIDRTMGTLKDWMG